MTPPEPISFPFAAIVGQDLLKRALLMNAVCPALGGVLIAGDRGTAKTTTARALAALLPRLAVVTGCPYRCDPEAVWAACPHCRGQGNGQYDIAAGEIAAPFVELPLGATEDRVAGSLEIERTLREGRPVFRPGLLAAAHRGVLYIDEVNLLADHLVDLLLDAAAGGAHSVEREGVAVRHPARFVLIGTMNPEEGELRPQLADRFALRIDIRTPTAAAERAEVIKRRQAFDRNPQAFCAEWQAEQHQISEAIQQARRLFPQIELTEAQLMQIATVCAEQQVEGLRADLALSRGARALAALAGRSQINAVDLQAAADLVLPHRRRRSPPQAQRPQENPNRNPFADDPSDTGAGKEEQDNEPDETGSDDAGPGETIALPLPGAASPKIVLTTEGAEAQGDRGRRLPLPGQPKGRGIRAVRDQSAGSLAIDATLRAAVLRTGASEGELKIHVEDLHWKQREDRRGSLIVFVVDASGSMGARRRMEAVKGVVMALLGDAKRLRDDVAVIAVRGPRAECLLPPTSDPRIAERSLARLPTGGRTPLAHGLVLASQLIHENDGPGLLVVVTDGKANVCLPGTEADPWQQSLAACGRLNRSLGKAIVIDAEEGIVQTGRARELAEALRGECLGLGSLSASGIGGALRDIGAASRGSDT